MSMNPGGRTHGRRDIRPVEKPKNFKKTVRRLFTFLKPYRLGFLLAVTFTILSNVATGLGPRIMGQGTNIIAEGALGGTGIDFSALLRIVLILMGLYLVGAVLTYFQHYLIAGISQKSMYSLRKLVDQKIRKLPLSYFDGNSFGDVLSRVTNDVDTVANSMQQAINQILSSLLSLIIVLVMMFVISPTLTLVGLLVIPLITLSTLGVVKRSQALFKGQQTSLGALNGHIEEIFSGHSVVKLYSGEEQVTQTFDEINDQLYQYGWKAQFVSNIIMPITMLVANLGYVIVTVTGGLMVISGRLLIGDIQSFIQYLRSFNQPLSQISQMANLLQAAVAAAERIFEFLDEREEVADTANPVVPQQKDGVVVFDHVHFGYNPEKMILNDLTLSVSSGEKIAIVGPTGAGKTTLVNLLMRFYELSGGRILIDGADITHMRRSDLRARFGMVLQDTWLFHGTILENIRYGRLSATDEEVYAAARAARADGFIHALPDGYNMVLTEDASNISQGQRQLLTIARAILADPEILILDEATSSVDTRTEVLIQHAMEELMKGRTSFVIAHRLSTIRDASRILVIRDGDIVETGTHQELLARDGFYAQLYNAQFTSQNAVS